MQIENNPAYTLLQPARGAQNQGLFDINKIDPARSGAAVSSATEARTVNNETALVAAGRPAQTGAISGTIRNLLSPRTTQLAIDQQIKEGIQADAQEGIQQDHSNGTQRFHDRMATDPVFAAKITRSSGSNFDALAVPLDRILDVPDRYQVFIGEGGSSPMDTVQKQRETLYEQKIAQGVPTLQIYMDILEFNLSLPDSYTDDVLDSLDLYPPGYYKSLVQADLDGIRDAMVRAATNGITETSNSKETVA